jgi:hypothetical protein
MKTRRLTYLAATVGSLFLISSAHAQPNTGNATSSNDQPDYGILGHSYAAIDADLIKYRNEASAPTGVGSDLKFNIETTDNFDIGLSYDINHAKNNQWSTSDQVGRLWTTGFYKFAALAPYLSAGSGYGWEHSRMTVGKTPEWEKFHRAIYDLGTGVELPVFAQASVRVGVNYESAFRRPHPTEWTYQTAFDYNFDDTIGVDTGINFQDGHKGGHDAIVYHAGIRFTFD